MKAKKLLAIITASTMVILSTSTAYAQTDLTGVDVTSDATVNYIDASGILDIVVPTSGSMAFTLDPQNLAATQGVGTWNPNGGGAILPLSVITVVNKSAIPVKTEVAFTVEDDATTPTVLLDDDATINDGTDRQMHLTVTPANAKTSVAAALIPIAATPVFFQDAGSDAIFTAAELTAAGVLAGNLIALADIDTALFGQFVCEDDAADPKTYNQVEVPVIAAPIAATTATTVTAYAALANDDNVATVADDGANLAFAIDNAEYYVSKGVSTYSLVYRDQDTNTNYDTASYIIGGTINKNANWSAYDAITKIALKAAYSFTIMTDAAHTTALTTKLTDSYNSVAYVAPVAPVIPSIATTTYPLTAATAVDVTVALGAGTSAATGITSITYNDGGVQTLATNKYSLVGNTLQFTSGYVNELITAEVASRAYTVTFNNTAATAVVVTLTYAAPSVAPTYFGAATTKNIARNATTFNVAFDLGIGDDAVTITDIYLTAAGTDFGPISYTYANGTITFATSNDTGGYLAYIVANAGSYPFKVKTSDSASATHDISVVVAP